MRMSVALARAWGQFLPVVETIWLWSSHRNPELTLRGPCISSRRVWSIRINSPSISCLPQPHLQVISLTEKFGVIILAMNSPVAMRKVLRWISQQHYSFPSASNFVPISVTILSSIVVVDFADAHSACITKTLSTAISDNINKNIVLAAPANEPVIIIVWLLWWILNVMVS